MNHLLTREDKKRIYNVLADAYIEVVNRQMIGKFERRALCKKILDNVGTAKTMDDVNKFLQDLMKNYPFFQFADKMFETEVKEIQQQKVINHLESFIHSQAK
jgi:hypothetical protein